MNTSTIFWCFCWHPCLRAMGLLRSCTLKGTPPVPFFRPFFYSAGWVMDGDCIDDTSASVSMKHQISYHLYICIYICCLNMHIHIKPPSTQLGFGSSFVPQTLVEKPWWWIGNSPLKSLWMMMGWFTSKNPWSFKSMFLGLCLEMIFFV